ncbi:unnamed protein product [Lota lota]
MQAQETRSLYETENNYFENAALKSKAWFILKEKETVMASWGVCLLSLTLICNIIARCDFSFVNLKCNDYKQGRLGQQSLLECIVNLSGVSDARIERVFWMKEGATLIEYKRGNAPKSEPRFTLAEPHRNEGNLNVSMLVTNTKWEDRGDYTCTVITSRGYCLSSASLELSVPYGTPTISRLSKNPNQKVAMTLSCNAGGGYPEGRILWFDEHGTNWTPSSKQNAIKTEDGRFNLNSRLDLLQSSTFFNYICAVYNIRKDREGETQYSVSVLDPVLNPHEGPTQKSDLASKIVIPVVIIGAVIIGLLIVRLLKPCFQSSHQGLPTNRKDYYEDEYPTKTMPGDNAAAV